jgi:hypothetical protein
MPIRECSTTPLEPSAGAPPLPAELRFVVECVRRSCGAPERSLPNVSDWSEVLRHTSSHAVFPAVDTILQAGGVEVPSQIRALIATGSAMAGLHRHQRQEPGIRLALTTLRDAGCSPVVLKGVALAYSRYPSPENRSFSDIDLLLPESQLERANRALQEAGFSVVDDGTVGPGHQHLPPLVAPHQAIGVELHRALFDSACPFPLNPRDLLPRAVPLDVLGIPVRELDPTDALLHICAHLSYGHRYARYPLRSLADILVLSRSKEINWPGFVARARGARMDGAVVWPLALARSWLGAAVPIWVCRSLAPPRPFQRVVDAVMRSGYILDRSTMVDDGTKVLFDLLLELSLYTGCSPGVQGRALMRGLFPQASSVTHLSPEVTSSPARYVLTLTHGGRLWRGARAFGQLLRLAAQQASLTRRQVPTGLHPERLGRTHATMAAGGTPDRLRALAAEPTYDQRPGFTQITRSELGSERSPRRALHS